uniref:Opine dehydrogenase domain-containing protein n=1 Tax=Ditylum brightwellii TaxID=49249 RepID=A0A6V2DNJ7_9STRA|mmetsp:Transcript_13700/g.19175  ORF Transcript_13700/g.19175 Transcript_13700/m.19175 type:complete len:506 (+) Transcript_13700:152-1669(+)
MARNRDAFALRANRNIIVIIFALPLLCARPFCPFPAGVVDSFTPLTIPSSPCLVARNTNANCVKRKNTLSLLPVLIPLCGHKCNIQRNSAPNDDTTITSTISPTVVKEMEKETKTNQKVGIIGAGAISYATAAILHENKHDPMIWSPSGKGTIDLFQSLEQQSSQTEGKDGILTVSGARDFKFTPRIASNLSQLVNENDILIIALPANGHLKVFQEMAPLVLSHHVIIISSHSSLGGLYLSQLLHDRFDKEKVPPIIAWGTTAATARQSSLTSVQICTVRSKIDLCTLPQSYASTHGIALCTNLFGTTKNSKQEEEEIFVERNGLLAISLSNLNAQNHLGIALGNMSRMERGESWSQMLNITPNIGRLLEELDQERLRIADACHVKVRTIFEHFSLSFHVPISSSISKMNFDMVHDLGIDVNGPNDANSRYVTEDVPYGLTLIVVLGKLVGERAWLHESGINIISAMYGREFEKENDLLDALALDNVKSVEELDVAGRTGIITWK